MFVDRHLYGGRLNYLLFGRWVEAAKNWLHRKTAPTPAPPATGGTGDADSEPVEDIALHRSYQYVPPSAPEEPAPESPAPPEAERKTNDVALAADQQPAPEQPVTNPPNPPEAEHKTDNAAPTANPQAVLEQPASEPPEQPATDAPREPTANPPAEPAPPPESDGYDEDEEYLRHMENVEYEPQSGTVNAGDLLVLLSIFSKKQNATEQEITTARRAMRLISGSEIEQAILDQLNGKDGYVAVMLDMITKELDREDDAPRYKQTQSDRDFNLGDYV